jgi:hypothetical protein
MQAWKTAPCCASCLSPCRCGTAAVLVIGDEVGPPCSAARCPLHTEMHGAAHRLHEDYSCIFLSFCIDWHVCCGQCCYCQFHMSLPVSHVIAVCSFCSFDCVAGAAGTVRLCFPHSAVLAADPQRQSGRCEHAVPTARAAQHGLGGDAGRHVAG